MRGEVDGTFFTVDLDARARARSSRCPGCARSRCGACGRTGSRSRSKNMWRWRAGAPTALVNTHGEVFAAAYRRQAACAFAGPHGERAGDDHRSTHILPAQSRRDRARAGADRSFRRAAPGRCGSTTGSCSNSGATGHRAAAGALSSRAYHAHDRGGCSAGSTTSTCAIRTDLRCACRNCAPEPRDKGGGAARSAAKAERTDEQGKEERT